MDQRVEDMEGSPCAHDDGAAVQDILSGARSSASPQRRPHQQSSIGNGASSHHTNSFGKNEGSEEGNAEDCDEDAAKLRLLQFEEMESTSQKRVSTGGAADDDEAAANGHSSGRARSAGENNVLGTIVHRRIAVPPSHTTATTPSSGASSVAATATAGDSVSPHQQAGRPGKIYRASPSLQAVAVSLSVCSSNSNSNLGGAAGGNPEQQQQQDDVDEDQLFRTFADNNDDDDEVAELHERVTRQQTDHVHMIEDEFHELQAIYAKKINNKRSHMREVMKDTYATCLTEEEIEEQQRVAGDEFPYYYDGEETSEEDDEECEESDHAVVHSHADSAQERNGETENVFEELVGSSPSAYERARKAHHHSGTHHSSAPTHAKKTKKKKSKFVAKIKKIPDAASGYAGVQWEGDDEQLE